MGGRTACRSRRRRGVEAALAGLAFVTLAACATGADFEYERDADPDAKFAGMHTFSWLPEAEIKVGDPRFDDKLLEKRLRDAVDAELQAKGYERRLTGEVDFFVDYHASLRKRLDVGGVNSQYGFDPTWRWRNRASERPESEAREYEAGTVILDVIGPDGHQLLWRGRVQTAIGGQGATEQQRIGRLEAGVKGVLAPFPAQH